MSEQQNGKQRILEAAVEEFSEKGYGMASTNVIACRAGVSKGLIFHYYGDKEEMFRQSVLFVMDVYFSYMMGCLSYESKDLFERMEQVSDVKIKFFKEYPRYFGMIVRLWYGNGESEAEGELKKEVIEKYYNAAYERFVEGLDEDMFADGLTVRKVINYAMSTVESHWLRLYKECGHEITTMLGRMDEYAADYREIIRLLKYGALKR